MAFIFQVDKNGHPRPKIRCDACGGIIENYADGFATLDSKSATPGAALETIFHCAHCQDVTEKVGKPQRSMRIDKFMLYALNNIQLTPNALEEVGRKLIDLDH
jgi:hypothetical protein